MKRLLKKSVLIYYDPRFVYAFDPGGKRLKLNIYWSFLSLCTHSHSKRIQKVEVIEGSYICQTIFQK